MSKFPEQMMFFLGGMNAAAAIGMHHVVPALLAVAFIYSGVKLMRQRNEQR